MDQIAHYKIVSFIWDIADDVLRDLCVRGKYRDVILPMCVLRWLDAVLEPTDVSLNALPHNPTEPVRVDAGGGDENCDPKIRYVERSAVLHRDNSFADWEP